MWASYKLHQSKEQKKLIQNAKFYHFPLTQGQKNEPCLSKGKFFQDNDDNDSEKEAKQGPAIK